MKKLKKLEIKKVTLRDLDDQTMQGVAAGATTPVTARGGTPIKSCKIQCGTGCNHGVCCN